jgi:hypothetical protein
LDEGPVGSFKVVVMDLRLALQEWTDPDVAAFHVARSLSIIGMDLDFHVKFKHVMWSSNPLGDSLARILRELVAAGVLEEEDERVRWNVGFKGAP